MIIMKRASSFALLILTVQLSALSREGQDKREVELIVPTGHVSNVVATAFSPNGRYVISGGDSTIKLWEVQTGTVIKTLKGSGSVNSLGFSPDGKRFVSGSSDSLIKVWDLETGTVTKTLRGHTAPVSSVIFSHDGKYLVSGGGDGAIRFWNVGTGTEIKTFRGHSEIVQSVALSPDGRYLVSGSCDNTIKIWNAETSTEIKSLSAVNGPTISQSQCVNSVAISPDGRYIVSGGDDSKIKIWEIKTGHPFKTLIGHAHAVYSVAFSRDGKYIVSGGSDGTIRFWDVETSVEVRSLKCLWACHATFSPDWKKIISGGSDSTVKIWDFETGTEIKTLRGHSNSVNSVAISPDGKAIASGSTDGTVNIWGPVTKTLTGHPHPVASVAFSHDGREILSESTDTTIKVWDAGTGAETEALQARSVWDISLPSSQRSGSVAFSSDGRYAVGVNYDHDNTIKIWNIETAKEVRTLKARLGILESVVLLPVSISHGAKYVAAGCSDNTIRIWDVETGTVINTLSGHPFPIGAVTFSHDGTQIAADEFVSGNGYGTIAIRIWDVAAGTETRTLQGANDFINSIAFSPDDEYVVSGSHDATIKVWNAKTGVIVKALRGHSGSVNSVQFSPNGKHIISGSDDNTIKIWDTVTGEEQATLIGIDKADWCVTTPEGRFDTNKSLDQIKDLHWIVNNEILKPLPIDVFMRHYYEPGLLLRILAGEQFKPLPSIADINRVQPNVIITGISRPVDSSDLVVVTVEVERVTDDVSTSAADRTKKKRLASGGFDLRLFRDRQLVGVSTPKDKLAAFINDAPRLVAETKAAGRLVDTPEDRAWREANDIFKIRSDDVKLISPDKIQYTFHNIKLPKDGRKEVEFTAYAFNADKVKSTTTEPFKFTIPTAVANAPKKGRAFLISIGVNASENPAYDLRYAANDARKMQEILGARLKADAAKYSEVIQIPLISDHGAGNTLIENTAQKAIIKGVFSLLAGNLKEVPPEVLKQIPNRDSIKAVEPEDTLIITYAGHGYADQAGIFYLLPYDIGKDTRQLSPEVLRKTISSDELSLWMQDITAAEMIMIIDACHSSAAVQGDGFKPGPMGSRGLGQLAYDKDMKILSATQADNVALELNSLEQGLLSYALLQDGIINSLADTDKNKQLFAAEWLGFAEKRVPELYQEVNDGKRGIFIDGRNVKVDSRSVELVITGNNQKSSLNLQQPSLFDFKRRNATKALFVLP